MEKYHGFRINQLHKKFPDRDRGQIKKDYFGYLNRSCAFLSSVVDGSVDLNYGIEVICSVDDNFPSKIKRMGISILDSLLTVV